MSAEMKSKMEASIVDFVPGRLRLIV